MNRRSFIGSVLGAVTGAPFLAKLDTAEWQRTVLDYRMLIRCNGCIIQAPGVAEIIPRWYMGIFQGYSFVAEPVDITRTLEIHSSIILTKEGCVIRECEFAQPAWCVNGDILKVDHKLMCTREATIEEVVARALANK